MSLMFAADALRETLANAENTASQVLSEIASVITTATIEEKTFCEFTLENNLSRSAKTKVVNTLLEFGYFIKEEAPTQMEKGYLSINWEDAK